MSYPREKINHKYKQLDSLRWVAAFAVGMGHAFLCFSVNGLIPKYQGYFWTRIFNGAYAVDLFFVLSGFVLINAAADDLSPRTYAAFVTRRALRIYPAAWMSLLLCLCALMTVHLSRNFGEPWMRPWAEGFLQMPDITVRGVIGALLLRRVNPVFWTINVEIAASLAYPLFANLIKKANFTAALLATVIAIIVSKYLRNPAHVYILDLLFMFMVGACLNFFRPVHVKAGRNSVLLIGIILMLLSHRYGELHSFNADLVSTISAALIIFSIAFWPPQWIERVLGAKSLVRLGRASYSYYLINPAVLFVLVITYPNLHLSPSLTSTDYVWYSLTIGIIAAIITIPLSLLSAESVERISIRLGRRFERYILSFGALAPKGADA